MIEVTKTYGFPSSERMGKGQTKGDALMSHILLVHTPNDLIDVVRPLLLQEKKPAELARMSMHTLFGPEWQTRHSAVRKNQKSEEQKGKDNHYILNIASRQHSLNCVKKIKRVPALARTRFIKS